MSERDILERDLSLKIAQIEQDIRRLRQRVEVAIGGLVPRGVGAHLTTSHALAAFTNNVILVDATSYDTDGYLTADGIITIPSGRGGFYVVLGQVQAEFVGGSDPNLSTIIFVNGAQPTVAPYFNAHLNDALPSSSGFTGGILEFDVGDIVQLIANPSDAGVTAVGGLAATNFITLLKVGL